MFSCWEQLQCHVFMLKKNNNNKQTLKCCVFMLSTTTVTGCFPIEYNHSIVFSGWVQLLFCVSSLSTHIVWSYSVVFSCWVQLSCCVFRLSTTIVFSCWVQLTIMLCFQVEYNCCVFMLSTTVMLCFQVGWVQLLWFHAEYSNHGVFSGWVQLQISELSHRMYRGCQEKGRVSAHDDVECESETAVVTHSNSVSVRNC